MDRTRGHPPGQLCALVWGSALGFYSQSFRFEGGGRQVIGLNRTGKSCRLRWVNYLHPGLKRGKMTPQEERLVLELQAKWGNRWSRIARKLPGRTDNEIKNYWRTHMRKKAQDMKRAAFPRSPSVNSPSSASTITTADSLPSKDTGKVTFYDTGGLDMAASTGKKREQVEEERGYSMDDIWKDIDQLSEENTMKTIYDDYSEDVCGLSYPSVASPSWEPCWDSLWMMDEEDDSKMLLPNNQFHTCCEYGKASLTNTISFI